VLLGCLWTVPKIPRQRTAINLHTFARDLSDFHRQTQPALAMLIYALIGASTIGFLAFTGDWLFRNFGYGIYERSQIFLWCGMASLVFSPISGIWADRSGKWLPSIIGSIGITVMMPVVAFLPGHPMLIYSGFLVLAAAISIRQSPLLTLITEMVPAERRGTFLAIKNAWTQIGAAFGNFAVGIVYNQGGFPLVAISCGILTAVTVFLLIRYIEEPAPAS
nr:MFS transporter [bacterium]